MTSRGHALSRDALIRTLTSYNGITTADGAVDGTTLEDSNLISRNEFISEKTILIMSGDAKDEDKGALSFVPATGVITVQGTGFSAQIKAGTIFRVLNISTVEMDVATIDGKIGTNTDPVGTTTLFAWLLKIFEHGGQGGFYYGKVTQIDDATHFRVAGLTGFGDAYFANTYRVYVVRDAAGLGAAPQGEMQPCSEYDSDDGIFTYTAFTAALAVDDEVLLLHERIAEIADLVTMLETNQYYDRIFYDEDTGIAGTAWPIGTPQVPSDVIADIITMCAARNIRTIQVHGALTLGAAMEHYKFIGYEHEDIADTLDLSGEDVDGSHIEGLIVTGAQAGDGFLTLVRCIVNAVTAFNGRMNECSFWGGVTTIFKDAGYIDLEDCDSIYGAVTIQVQTPTRASIKDWKGNLILTAQDGGICLVRGFKGTLEIDAMTAGTLDVYANGADITINADCIGTGTINIHGNARVIDNHGAGTTVNDYTIDSKIGTAADPGDLGTLFSRHVRAYLGTHTHVLVVIGDTSTPDADLDTALQQWLLEVGFVVTLADPTDVAGYLEAGSFDLVIVSASCDAADAANLANLKQVGAPVICHSADIAADALVFDMGGTPHSHAAQTQIEIMNNTPMWLIALATGDLTVTASAAIYAMNTKATAAVTLAEAATGTDDHLTVVRLLAGEENEAGYAAFYDRYFVGVGDYTNMNAVWLAVMADLVMHCVMEKRFTEEAIVQVKGVYQEDVPDTDVTDTATTTEAECVLLEIGPKNNRTYVLRNLRIKAQADPTPNTMTVRLYEYFHGALTEVHSFGNILQPHGYVGAS